MSIPAPTTSSEITVTSNTSGNKTVAGVAVGDLLVVQVCDIGEASVTFSASDDKGNTWATAASQAGSDAGNSAYILYAIAASAGSTVVTVTASGTTDFVAKVHLVANPGGYFNLGASSNIYKSSSIGASYPCSASTSEIDTVYESIVFTAGVTDGPGDGGFGTLTVGSGYTEVTCSTSVAFWQYQIFTVPIADERGTFTSSAGKKAATCIAAFTLRIPCQTVGGSGDCWWPCCSESGEEGDPLCATVGDVGSESGDECTTCSTQVILDDFSSLHADWTGGGPSCIINGIGPFGAHVTGGQMNMGAGATILRPFTRPALSGFCVEVKATLVSYAAGAGVAGIVVPFGRMFFARLTSADYGRQSCIDSLGCILGGSSFASFGTFAAGDVLGFIIRDQGDADGICSICYQVNGSTVRVEENVITCFPNPMYAGLLSTGTSVVFDDFEVRTS